ncbi:L,D-transpeptidase [Bacillus songklensis]|uniref:L,D-transpeptidase n=1 Tax=Bacillus songklensis TaxID=1069116 RepID=A0ABV8B0T7_9BACI
MRKLVFGLILAVFMIFSTISATPASAASKNQFIIINKSTNRLAFFENGKLVRTFSVGTGRQISYTPEGTFTIVNKIKNRPYYKGGIPGGDPRNPLGDRWLGLNARGTYGTTYGIHGNNNPSSIGKYVSSGCVRMYDEEVRWLFDRVELHTKVIIGQFKSQAFEAIASKYGYNANVCKGVCFKGSQLSKGQVGFLTVKKPMPLMVRTKEGKYEVISTLPVNKTYKVYEVNKNLALVNIGGKFVHYNLDRIHISYLPADVIKKVNEYYN